MMMHECNFIMSYVKKNPVLEGGGMMRYDINRVMQHLKVVRSL